METETSVRVKARKLRARISEHDEIPAKLIDVDNEDGVDSVRVTDGTNLVWVLLYDEINRVAQAYNLTTQYRVNAPVWVRKMPDKTLEVVRIRARDGSDLFGDAAPTINAQPVIGELSPDTLWPGRNLIPGRLYATAGGGMTVYIAPFHYDGGYFPGGTEDLTANIPGTASTKAWVKVYINPDAATADDLIGATTGTEVSLAMNPMDEADLAAIAIEPTYIPVAGLVLFNGDTAIDDTTQVVDARQWLNPPSKADAVLVTPTINGSLTLDGISSGFANSQEVTLQAGLRTTDDTVTTIASITVPESRGIVMRAAVIGVKSDHTEAIMGDILYGARRASGGNVTEIAAATIRQAEDSGVGPPVISADVDTGTQTMRIRVQGIAAVTYDWVVTYSYHFVASNA